MKIYPILLTASLLLSACGSDTPGSSSDPLSQNVETIGTIEGKLNGESRTWFITRGEFNGEVVSQSDWSSMFSNHVSVNLLGHASDDTALQPIGALLVNFEAMNVDQTATLSSREIVYMESGMTEAYTSDMDGGSATISLDRVSVQGDSLTVSGTLDASLQYRKAFNTSAAAPSVTVMALTDGHFEATLSRLGN